jgi:hypothetical protein
MTEDELKERAEIYRQLIDYKPFLYLIEEVNGDIKDAGEGILNDNTGNPRLYDKGIIAGKKAILQLPYEAIEEAEQYNENS